MATRSLCLLPALFALAALGIPDQAEASPRKSNSATRLPRNLHVGDVDGDGLQDLVQFGRNKVLAYKANYARDGILHGYLPSEINRLVLGDFTTSGREHRRDQVCAVTKANTLMCYASSDDHRELWWWFTQPSFINAAEQIVVGDFDGNGADDLLLYNKSTGGMRFFTRYSDKAQFQPMKNVTLGNLDSFDRKNKILLAGDFGQAVGRDDLMFWDKKKGRLSRFDSVTDEGKTTFWWAFHTKAGFVEGHEVVRVANVEGGSRDGIAVFDSNDSQFRFYKAVYANGNLQSAGNLAGNLAGKKGFVPVLGHFARYDSEPGTKRDDVMLYEHASGQLLRFDARWDKKTGRRTYWSAYRAAAPSYHLGWPAMRKDKIVLAKCKFEGTTAEPRTHAQIRNRFAKSGRGKEGFWDYAWEQSYGMVDVDITMPAQWKTMPYTETEWMALPDRGTRIAKCMQTHGIDEKKYRSIVAYINTDAEVGQQGARAVFYKDQDHANVVAHEMMHTYGLPHAFNAAGQAYMDGYDVMGGIPDYSYTGTFARTGVGIGAYYRSRVGFLPSNRRLVLVPGSTEKTKTVALAALDRPECNGMLLVEIRKSDGTKIAVEFREKRGWDRNLPGHAVVVRRVAKHPNPEDFREVTYLQESNGGPQYTVGETFEGWGVKVKVTKLKAWKGTAEVQITY